MLAAKLLDSRSFKNKLDYFVSVASRKRPKPTDEELAEALEPILEAARGQSVAPVSVAMAAPSPAAIAEADASIEAEIARLARATPKGPYVHQEPNLDAPFAEFVERAKQTPPGADGVRIVYLSTDYTVDKLHEYIERTKPGIAISEQHQVLTPLRGGPEAWGVPIYA